MTILEVEPHRLPDRRGYHESAWRLADPANLGPGRFGVLERVSADARARLLDAVFFADSPGFAFFRRGTFPRSASTRSRLLAALSRTTTRIGLIATASTTYSAPYDLARGSPPSIICPAAGPAGTS